MSATEQTADIAQLERVVAGIDAELADIARREREAAGALEDGRRVGDTAAARAARELLEDLGVMAEGAKNKRVDLALQLYGLRRSELGARLAVLKAEADAAMEGLEHAREEALAAVERAQIRFADARQAVAAAAAELASLRPI